MDKEMLMEEAFKLQDKLAAIHTILDEEGITKEAANEWMKAMSEARKKLSEGGKKPSFKEVAAEAKKIFGKGKKGEEDKKEEKKASEETPKESAEEPKETPKESAEESDLTSVEGIVAEIDKVAASLEEKGGEELLKHAYQLDLVSDVLEGKKEAKALESDADEPYMKEYFRAGAREKDADEPYMNEFNTDLTQEVAKLRGKAASKKDLPYQKDS